VGVFHIVDVLVLFGADGQAEFGRVEGQHFGVGDVGRAARVAAAGYQVSGAVEEGEQVAAQHRLRPGRAGQGQDGGGDVEQADLLPDFLGTGQAGNAQQERHANAFVVEPVVVMAPVTVLHELRAVVGGEDQGGVLPLVGGLQVFDETADLLVDKGQLLLVDLPPAFHLRGGGFGLAPLVQVAVDEALILPGVGGFPRRFEAAGAVVGPVQVHVVQPEEFGRLAGLDKPVDGGVGDLIGRVVHVRRQDADAGGPEDVLHRPLRQQQRRAAKVQWARQGCGVSGRQFGKGIEAPVQADPGAAVGVGAESGRLVAVLLQDVGQQRPLRVPLARDAVVH
jgi:hypothetical protein